MGKIIFDETVELAAYDWVSFSPPAFNLVVGNTYKVTIGTAVYTNLVAFENGDEIVIGDASSFSDPPFLVGVGSTDCYIMAGDGWDGNYRVVIEDLSAVGHETLTSLFTDIANSIRAKTGAAGQIVADKFPEAIDGIPTSKAKQACLASSSVNTSTVNTPSYSTALSMTVEKTGTYKVSWVGIRNTNAGTSGTQLYINGSAYDTARTTFDGQNIYFQHILLTGVELTAGQTIEVRARARTSSYWTTVANFVIEEE